MKKHKKNMGKILNYLKTHKKGISSMEAFEKFGVTRLSAVIFILRKEYEIINEKCIGNNRFGDKVKFVRFKLVGEI